MRDFSPMMRRVRRDKNWAGSRIPRKGRIRAALLFITCGLVVWAVLNGSSFIMKKSSGVSAAEVTKKEKPVNKKQEKKKECINGSNVLVNAAQMGSNNNTDVETVAPAPWLGDLIRDSKLSFDSPIDSFVKDRRSITIYTSIDTSLQKLGLTLMRRYKPKYGAIVAMDPVSGRVLSLVSYENDSVPSLGGNLYCKSMFPAASIFKTITAAAAVEIGGLTGESTIQHTGRNHTLYKYQLEPELKIYKDVTLEDAFANSINPVFARIGMYVLRSTSLADFSKRFGFDTEIPFELPVDKSVIQQPDSNFTVAELASGFNQRTTLSPVLGALIASSISEKGRMPLPHCIDSIKDNGNVTYKSESKVWKNSVSSRTADVVKDCMKGVSRYGTARKSFYLMKRSARFDIIDYGGKTGSVDKDTTGRVDWFIGFARHPDDVRQRIAVGIVTVHGAYWTVHSSFIGAEIFRVYLREIQLADDRVKQEIVTK